MAEEIKDKARIVRQEEIADDIYSMWIETQMAQIAKPGQFVSLYSDDRTKLLPRPISICEIDKEHGCLHLVYRIAGEGTRQFSSYHAGHRIDVIGPLGNGFTPTDEQAIVIGGGIGIPPMLELSKHLKQPKIVLGYRDMPFMQNVFEQYGDVYVATEDGCAGTKGTVIDAIKEHQLKAKVIYACGPKPMLKAIKAYALEHDMTCFISLEERMACGVGACLGCVCQSTDKDAHSHVHNKRICKDGPVFDAREVEL